MEQRPCPSAGSRVAFSEPEGVEDDKQLKRWIERAVKFVGKLPGKEK